MRGITLSIFVNWDCLSERVFVTLYLLEEGSISLTYGITMSISGYRMPPNWATNG
jgi:hypothetical protein